MIYVHQQSCMDVPMKQQKILMPRKRKNDTCRSMLSLFCVASTTFAAKTGRWNYHYNAGKGINFPCHNFVATLQSSAGSLPINFPQNSLSAQYKVPTMPRWRERICSDQWNAIRSTARITRLMTPVLIETFMKRLSQQTVNFRQGFAQRLGKCQFDRDQ